MLSPAHFLKAATLAPPSVLSRQGRSRQTCFHSLPLPLESLPSCNLTYLSGVMAETNGAVPDAHSVAHQSSSQDDPTAADSTNSGFPTNSQVDKGQSKRPRDARLIHLVLANYGVNAYQERIPLQLMDFAYRYTSSTLQ